MCEVVEIAIEKSPILRLWIVVCFRQKLRPDLWNVIDNVFQMGLLDHEPISMDEKVSERQISVEFIG